MNNEVVITTLCTAFDGTTGKIKTAGARIQGSKKVFQIIGRTTASTGSATVAIEGSLVDTDADYKALGSKTISLSTTDATDNVVVDAPWPFVRVNVTSISGTGANVDVYMAQCRI